MFVYIDPDDLKSSLTLSGTTFADEDIEPACFAASAGVEMAQGRQYGKTETDEARLFVTDDPDVLLIDDLVSLTSVRASRAGDGTWTTLTVSTDFRLEPLNAAFRDRPYTRLRSLNTRFPAAVTSVVEVTGVYGWPSVPYGVSEAASIIASQLIKRKREAPFGFQITADGAAYIARTDPQIAFLLNGLSKRQPLRSVQAG